MEYVVVYEERVHKLEKRVNELLKKGYTLVGGVACSGGQYCSEYYLQALIKEDAQPKP